MRVGSRVLVSFLSFLLLATVLAFGQQGQPASGTIPDKTTTETADPSSLPNLKPDANGNLSQEQMQQLLRVVAYKEMEYDKRCAITPTLNATKNISSMARDR